MSERNLGDPAQFAVIYSPTSNRVTGLKYLTASVAVRSLSLRIYFEPLGGCRPLRIVTRLGTAED